MGHLFLQTFHLSTNMPVSEQSFEDRLGRATNLKDACAGMSPAFAPAEADLSVASQTALLTALTTCCTNVSMAVTNLKDATDPRATSVKVIKERATRALNRVLSSHVWSAKVPNVKAAADKLRAFKLPKDTTPPPPSDPDAPPPKKRDRGGQSYKDIEGQLHKFIGALNKCSAYDTGAPLDITGAAFMSLYTTLKTANDTISDLEGDLTDVRIDRLRRFENKKALADGTRSLRDRWGRIKKSVLAQYGRTSAQYEAVRGINY